MLHLKQFLSEHKRTIRFPR